MDPMALASLLPPLLETRGSSNRALLTNDASGSKQGFGELFDSLLASPETLTSASGLSAVGGSPSGGGDAPWMQALSDAQQRRREAWIQLTGGPMPASTLEMEQAARDLFQAGLIDLDTYVELTASPFDTPQGGVWKEEGNSSSTQNYFDTYMQQVTQQTMMKQK